MPSFAKGMPRLTALLSAVVSFSLAPPQALAHGPKLCLLSLLFHAPSCPACGSTRALAAFFHGHLAQAIAFNRNVVITGPLLVALLLLDVLRFSERALTRSGGSAKEP